MTSYFGYISGICIVLSFLPYLISMFAGKTKPERASWLIWSILGGIAFFSQLAKGAGSSLWLPGVQTCGDLLIFVLAIRYGMGGFAKRDRWGLAVAAMSLILWYVTHEAAVALILAIIMDASGAVLTVMKAYEHPATEPITAWILTMLGALCAIFAVGSWNWILLIFPLYSFIGNAVIVASIRLGKRGVMSAS